MHRGMQRAIDNLKSKKKHADEASVSEGMHGACDSIAQETLLCAVIVTFKAGNCAMGACDKTS